MDKNSISVFVSKGNDDWGTPKWLYDELDAEFRFDLDPCPLNADFDGLQLAWFGNVFVNPPYSRVGQWLEKAHRELGSGMVTTIVFLVFANTDTRWFHEYVLGKAEIRFLKGRVKFDGRSKCGAMRPSMVVVYIAKKEG